jgi:hypothetical protein
LTVVGEPLLAAVGALLAPVPVPAPLVEAPGPVVRRGDTKRRTSSVCSPTFTCRCSGHAAAAATAVPRPRQHARAHTMSLPLSHTNTHTHTVRRAMRTGIWRGRRQVEQRSQLWKATCLTKVCLWRKLYMCGSAVPRRTHTPRSSLSLSVCVAVGPASLCLCVGPRLRAWLDGLFLRSVIKSVRASATTMPPAPAPAPLPPTSSSVLPPASLAPSSRTMERARSRPFSNATIFCRSGAPCTSEPSSSSVSAQAPPHSRQSTHTHAS